MSLGMASIRLKTKSLLLLLLFSPGLAQVAVDSQFPIQLDVSRSSNQSVSCQKACASLQDTLGSSTYQGDLADFVSQYFLTQNLDFIPQCVVQPETSEQVSQVINIVREQECKFAVKSGGHGTNAGSSNIHDGVVIDLIKMNTIELSEDESTVSLGPGARWRDVYSALEEHGLSTAGGRVSSVGVGGFTLAGGISYFSRLLGMACDNVREFEVVLANGTIVIASKYIHTDLYFALRGGGNNFGIVTRFEFETYRVGPIWGGTYVYTLEDLEERRASLGIQNHFSWDLHSITRHLARLVQQGMNQFGLGTKTRDVIEAFATLSLEESDPAAHAYIFLCFIPWLRGYISGSTLAYAKPDENPNVFKPMLSLKHLYSTKRIANVSGFAAEVDDMNQHRQRQIWQTATFKVDTDLMSQLWDIFLLETDKVTNVPGTLTGSNFQIFTKDMIAKFSKNGGNALGMVEEDGPLFMYSVAISWDNPEDDEKMIQAVTNSITKGTALGKMKGLHHPFIYGNYAEPGAPIIASYGRENQDRLLKIQKMYDPDKIFTRLQPGNFKL